MPIQVSKGSPLLARTDCIQCSDVFLAYRKVIPIQGTSLTLDTPEAIDAWISERKRRFPTADRVEDKQKKIEEAAARGQLPLEFNGGRFPNKRRRLDEPSRPFESRGRGRGRGERGRGFGRGRGRATSMQDRAGLSQSNAESSTSPSGGLSSSIRPTGLPKKPDFAPTIFGADRTEKGVEMGTIPPSPGPASDSDDTTSESGSDSAPEVISSKGRAAFPADIPGTATNEVAGAKANSIVQPEREVHPSTQNEHEPVRPARRHPARQPKRLPHNPFAARPPLLRNVSLGSRANRYVYRCCEMCSTDADFILISQLLLPEIRMTVSNLSQAIRFLVDNDFLENVELRAGQADERMIEVVGESEHTDDATKEANQASSMETTASPAPEPSDS